MHAQPAAALAALLVALTPAALHAQTPAAEVKDAASVSLLRLNTDAGLVVRGTYGAGAIPATGAGVRLMWHPAKAAFRAGYVGINEWDDANVGLYSVALGQSTMASGLAATATGYNTVASGITATAMGNLARATGDGATALGNSTTASGGGAMALGYLTTANADYSTAMGYRTTANGRYSTAMGTNISAGGNEGAFVIGDAGPTYVTASGANQFSARFEGGYKLFTSANLATGIQALNGATSWSSISDSTRKTGYVPADGEAMLAGLSRLRLGSWSYRGRPLEERHYGPMAQDFFREFGRDTRGVIGNDTLLATADVDGVLFVAAQAIERRTRTLEAENAALRAENASLADRLARVEAALARLTASAAPAPAETLADRLR